MYGESQSGLGTTNRSSIAAGSGRPASAAARTRPACSSRYRSVFARTRCAVLRLLLSETRHEREIHAGAVIETRWPRGAAGPVASLADWPSRCRRR
jgi:hypothetical protein